MVDDDGIWWLQQLVESAGNLVELHALTLKNLTSHTQLATQTHNRLRHTRNNNLVHLLFNFVGPCMDGYLSQVLVAVDVLMILTVLQLVCPDVLPQAANDDGPGLCVHAQQPCQARVQLELHRLQTTPMALYIVIQHQ